MRYEGQGYEVEVALLEDQPIERLAAGLPTLFAAAYRRVFQIDYPEQPIEIVNWKVEAVGPRPVAGGRYLSTASHPPGSAGKGKRRAFFPEADGFVETPVFNRYALSPGDMVEGPALIEDRDRLRPDLARHSLGSSDLDLRRGHLGAHPLVLLYQCAREPRSLLPDLRPPGPRHRAGHL
jgi:hypothetical protein